MEYRELGNTGMSLSCFAFGGIVVRDTDQTEANRIVSESVDLGVNYYDVAPSYGNAENILGPALLPHRNKVFLACKTGMRDKNSALEELKSSLKLLHTDYFDVYQMHAVTTTEDVDKILAPGGALEAFVEAKKAGLIKNIGFSAHSEEAALRLMKNFDFDTVLFPVNWALMFKKGMGEEVLKLAAEKNMGRLALKALAGRPKNKEEKEDDFIKCWYRPIFDNLELADLALRFTLNQDVHTAISPGDYRMFKIGISILDKYNGKVPPLTAEEQTYLQSEANKMTEMIFK